MLSVTFFCIFFMKGGGRLYGRGLNCIHVTGQLCADLTKWQRGWHSIPLQSHRARQPWPLTPR